MTWFNALSVGCLDALGKSSFKTKTAQDAIFESCYSPWKQDGSANVHVVDGAVQHSRVYEKDGLCSRITLVPPSTLAVHSGVGGCDEKQLSVKKSRTEEAKGLLCETYA